MASSLNVYTSQQAPPLDGGSSLLVVSCEEETFDFKSLIISQLSCEICHESFDNMSRVPRYGLFVLFVV